jgi:DNA-binding NarL/FixJ family response regulator
MFSIYAEEQYAIRALKTGAAGYVTKNSEPEVLMAALRKVAHRDQHVWRRYVMPRKAAAYGPRVTVTSSPAPGILQPRSRSALAPFSLRQPRLERSLD